ncbi:hypothetical protein [Shouchella shacheensis]|uniref:hypothetical protein n=1 Tax=Shouchella shacheensis TaxID=1649580 RepID=UPI000A61EBFE|nr:hypothetical protein [Shouchella shacheensis]
MKQSNLTVPSTLRLTVALAPFIGLLGAIGWVYVNHFLKDLELFDTEKHPLNNNKSR